VAQAQVALHRRAAQVKDTMLQAGFFRQVLFVHLERRRRGRVEDLDLVREHLDLARGQIGIHRAGGTVPHLARHSQDVFGAQLVVLWHEILHRIPVVNSIYSSVKQISDTLFSSSGQAFRKALLVQWPQEGMWTIAFLTGTPGGGVASHLPPDCVAVYVPTTPNPTGGYFVIIARKNVIELDMSVDQALKYVISMGVAPPQR